MENVKYKVKRVSYIDHVFSEDMMKLDSQYIQVVLKDKESKKRVVEILKNDKVFIEIHTKCYRTIDSIDSPNKKMECL